MDERRPISWVVGKTIADVAHINGDRFRIRFTDACFVDVATNELFDDNGMFFENDAPWENTH